ncbi:MAG: hypothetical protein IT210_01355 [Armatimonadetes bacterium]|nr:hypothetical protein [Armatimonadota bacterium]
MLNILTRLIPKEKKEALRQEVTVYLQGLRSEPFDSVPALRKAVLAKIESYNEIPALGKQLLSGRVNGIQARAPAEFLDKLIAEVQAL